MTILEITEPVDLERESIAPMPRPAGRGACSAGVLQMLEGNPDAATPPDLEFLAAGEHPIDVLTDDDLQLTLTTLYELHYRGIEGVDDRWEWHPAALRVRATLEVALERALRQMVAQHPISRFLPQMAPPSSRPVVDDRAVMDALEAMTAPTHKPGLAAYLARRANLDHYREFLIHRSVYQLKEADPHTLGIPRLSGKAKAALVEIQSDEYGGGRPEWVHAHLFARSMAALGLRSRYGYYLDQVPAIVLAAANSMSLFGLHRRLRGALVGHLAAFEMTSTLPNRQYAQGLRRLGQSEDATLYFDEHVEADAVHEQIALRDLAGALARQEPHLGPDIILGAATVMTLDDLVGEHLLSSWDRGRSSLRNPDRSPAIHERTDA
ncbi:iron-containing redox enzyme family protein [Kineosporia sp. J2-2]|uniref:Iron-containing redox enzyme family protein n=1 Tax=Kineosporia corallincola TaxID=2835133 RepID=A0ABS5TQ04_9ACTN|nr:iron-containing redox enzyme family protein [Kineosporia corallincola]MBT0773180.1 iron-containing redox enzyme family protein [Kineosporia corallincola]